VNLERPEVVRALAGVAALMLVVGLIGALTVDSGDATNVSAGRRATTTTAGASPTTVATAPPAATATTKGGATATTPKASGTPSTVAGRVPDPGATKPPRPGTYTYKTSGESSAEVTDKIEAEPDQGGAARRKDTTTDAQGNTVTSEEAWAADSVKILSTRIVSPYLTIDCTWQPPILVAQLPLAAGTSWSSDSTCTATIQGAQATIRRIDNYKVTGKVMEKVGAVSVPVWVIESTSTTTARHPFFSQDESDHGVLHFSPPHGLVTYQKSEATTGSSTVTSERTLLSVTPK
jgi:hypothetical protein